MVNVYQLNEAEIEIINNYNAQKTDNVLLIVCGFGDGITGVIAEDLNSDLYADYKALLEYDESRIVEVEETGGFI
ncbi:MAG TPA: hypothetical protein PK024_08475 [Methanospirillum sp.]|uniref:hypothetical protein n=1 Tax=Methanospirillum sp. TaxID=45200 RepID=UPI002C4F9A11|nr:hypothetical protein [Methanospirillum sp.]HOJ96852.1 hypothetical protein [Methanospirillum sp.]